MIGGRGGQALGPLCVSIPRPIAQLSADTAHPLPTARGPPLLSQARCREPPLQAEMTAYPGRQSISPELNPIPPDTTLGQAVGPH
jgi:hypothetical protein